METMTSVAPTEGRVTILVRIHTGPVLAFLLHGKAGDHVSLVSWVELGRVVAHGGGCRRMAWEGVVCALCWATRPLPRQLAVTLRGKRNVKMYSYLPTEHFP